MEEPTTPSPQILEPVIETTPEITGTPPQTPSVMIKKKPNLLPVFAIIFIILLVLIVTTTVQNVTTTSTTVTATSTPTPTGTFVSTRVLSPFATDSAFLKFETTVESLPKVIQGAVLLDQTIMPPVLELPLGF